MPRQPIQWRIDAKGRVSLLIDAGGTAVTIGGYMDLQNLMVELHDRILPEVEAEIGRREGEKDAR